MNKKYYMLLYGLLLLSTMSFAQEAKFKAIFIYNFTRYLEWPAAKQNGDFVIGVYGKSDLTEALKIIAGKKKVSNQNIVIMEISSSSDIPGCHIVYIPANQSSKLREIASKTEDSGTILITDKPGLGKTLACINFIQIDGKQNFEINKTNIHNQGVKINSTMLSLGVVID